MTDAEIAGYMNWRGPGAYTQHQMKRIRQIVEEAQRREREACAQIVEREAEQYAEPVWAVEIVNDIRARGQS